MNQTIDTAHINTLQQQQQHQLIANLINKKSFNPHSYNCVLQSSSCGIIELITTRDILIGEEIVCWFANDYLKCIKGTK